MAQGFLFIAAGLAVVLLALVLAVLLYRASRTMAALEEMVSTATDELRETLPEVREGLGNVNDITSHVNTALRVAGSEAARAGAGLSRSGRRLRIGLLSALHGIEVGAAVLVGARPESEGRRAGGRAASEGGPQDV